MDKNLKCLYEVNRKGSNGGTSKLKIMDDGVGLVFVIQTDNDPSPETNVIMGLSLEEGDDMIKCLSSKLNIIRKVRKK